MASVNLEDVRQILRHHKKKSVTIEASTKKAAVAAVFRQEAELELLFIRRAEHPNDPWSGHMAFPGGRVDPTDASPLEAAHREANEEIALDLGTHATLLGELSAVPAAARGRRIPMVVLPYVFELHGRPELFLDTREVQEAVWVPVPFFLDSKNRRVMKSTFGDVPIQLPCYYYEGRQIWGLTLKMADELFIALQNRSAP